MGASASDRFARSVHPVFPYSHWICMVMEFHGYSISLHEAICPYNILSDEFPRPEYSVVACWMTTRKIVARTAPTPSYLDCFCPKWTLTVSDAIPTPHATEIILSRPGLSHLRCAQEATGLHSPLTASLIQVHSTISRTLSTFGRHISTF